MNFNKIIMRCELRIAVANSMSDEDAPRRAAAWEKLKEAFELFQDLGCDSEIVMEHLLDKLAVVV